MLKVIVEIALAFLVASITSCTGAPVLAATEGHTEVKTEENPQMEVLNAGDVVFINEIGAVIVLRDKNIIVDIVSPPDQRAKEYQSVDLKKDDIILMINGKKAAALKELNAAYESVPVGQEVKLGIRRGKNMMIASFAKADQSQMQQQVVTMDGGDVALAGGNKKVMKFGPGDGNITILSELALILSEVDSKVAVTGIMDSENPVVKKVGIALNDVVTDFQSKKIGSLKEFHAAYDKLKIGDEFTISFQHDGKVIMAKATKTAPDNKPMMIKTYKNK